MAKRGRKTAKAKDDKGYLDSNKSNATPYKVIRGNKITMEGVSGKIYAIPIDSKGEAGEGRLMKPGENHTFEGASHVIEVPEVQMAQAGIDKSNNTGIGIGNQFMNFAGDVGGWFSNKLINNFQNDIDLFKKNWANDKDFFEKEFNPDNWDVNNLAPEPKGVGLEKSIFETYPSPLESPENPLPSSNPSDYPQQGLEQGVFGDVPSYDYFNDPEQKMKGQQQAAEQAAYLQSVKPENTLLQERANNIQQLESTNTPYSPTTEELLKAPPSYDIKDIKDVEDSNPIEETEKIQFNNPYGGVDINSASNILGKSFAYEGDQTGANTARGVGSGLKLLAGLGRNIMSGYGQQKRNQFVRDEANRKQKEALRTTTSLQKGGNITDKDLTNIREASDIAFNHTGANALFERVPENSGNKPSIDFGRYEDVNYFDIVGYQGDKVIISNSSRNPMNYNDNRNSALEYLMERNEPESFIFQYNNEHPQAKPESTEVVSRKKGGEVKASDLLTGAFTTGNPMEVPNVETEKGEHIKDNRTGKVKEVLGEKHSKGGEKMNLEDHKVLSDYNKIGGDLAKKYRDEFDIKIKAKDTFATAFDKVLKKTGYTSITEDLSSYIEKTKKEQERDNKTDSEATSGLNLQFLSGKINELNKQLEPLEELKSGVFETMFDDQQSKKTSKEIAEENTEMKEGGEINLKRPDNVSEEQWQRAVELYESAVRAGDRYPELTVAQAALETGWFKSPSGDNNIFGQKATASQDSSDVVTHEYIDGKRVKITDNFRDYDSLDEAIKDRMRLWGEKYKDQDTIKGAIGEIAGTYATDPNYQGKIMDILGMMGISPDYSGIDGSTNGMPPVPEGIQSPQKRGSTETPWRNDPNLNFVREDFNSDQPLTNIDGSKYVEGDDITATKEFREWFNNNKSTNALTPNGIVDINTSGIGDVNAPTINAPISAEERERRKKENTTNGTVEESDNTNNQTLLLPDQSTLPPSSMQPHILRELTPREAEAVLVSSEAQLEEINRQFVTAKSEINSLPDSQRRAALAQLNAQTQQSINKVMSQTNRTNAQIKAQTQSNNITRKAGVDKINAQLADKHEMNTLIAKDKTDNQIRNYFNAQSKNNVANYRTVQQMNLMNQLYDNYQYNGMGGVEQVGDVPDAEYLKTLKDFALATEKEKEEKKTKKAKRGRKIK